MSPWIRELFLSIDRMDAVGFASFIEPNGTFKFGNWPPSVGTAAIEAAVGGFFGTIAGLSHNVTEAWEVPGWALVRGEVTYTRKDGSTLTLPFFDAFRMSPGGKVQDYLIYMDVNPLYAPAG